MKDPVEHNKVDDISKLLDNGWSVTLFRSDLGSYSARAHHPDRRDVVTDDSLPSAALYRLAEKVTTGRIVVK